MQCSVNVYEQTTATFTSFVPWNGQTSVNMIAVFKFGLIAALTVKS